MSLPETLPLRDTPSWPLPLHAPPTVRWFGIGRHGRHPVEHYRFPGLWSLHLYRWSGALEIEGVLLPVRPGYASVIPLGTTIAHHFTGPSVHISAGFLPAGEGAMGTAHLPAMLDLENDFGPLWNRMEKGVIAQGAQSPRAAALLWEILWQLAERAPQLSGGLPTRIHPAVARVQELVELRLSESLRVAELAATVELSHNHLTRLFQEAFGMTVIAYIRNRRVQRARQLLQYSTVPVKSVALQVGLADLHQFNKTIRAATGLSPRQLRRQTGSDANAL